MQGGVTPVPGGGVTPVAVPNSREWALEGPNGGVRVMAAFPDGPAPPGGLPLLCLLDGGSTFATAVDAARVQGGRPALTGVEPAVILGLGHGGTREARDAARRRDYAPPPAGGGDGFLRFVADTVLPLVEAVVPLDRERAALFGHSIGGLLPVWALLGGGGGGPFRRFVAASPSLWWEDGALLRLARAGGAPLPGARLLLTLGELERAGSPLPAPDPAREERMRRARMAENLEELRALLAPRLPVDWAEFAGENHGSVLPAAIARAVPFALRRDEP